MERIAVYPALAKNVCCERPRGARCRARLLRSSDGAVLSGSSAVRAGSSVVRTCSSVVRAGVSAVRTCSSVVRPRSSAGVQAAADMSVRDAAVAGAAAWSRAAQQVSRTSAAVPQIREDRDDR